MEFIERKLNLPLLKLIKEENGLTQRELIASTEKYYPLSKSMLDSIVTQGNDNVTAETLIKLCIAYGVTPNQLVLNPESEDGNWDNGVISILNKEMQKQLSICKADNKRLKVKAEMYDSVIIENKKIRKIIKKYIK